MNRRSFLGRALGGLVALLAAPLALARPATKSLAAVHVLRGHRWQRVRMISLRVGDCFTVEGQPGLYEAESEPFVDCEHGVNVVCRPIGPMPSEFASRIPVSWEDRIKEGQSS